MDKYFVKIITDNGYIKFKVTSDLDVLLDMLYESGDDFCIETL